MSTALDLTGLRMGRLTAIRRISGPVPGGRHVMWECACVCGKTTQVRGTMLKNGRVKSCGCLMVEKRAVTHRKLRAAVASRAGSYVVDEDWQ